MICPKCGKESVEKAKYCEWCGNRLTFTAGLENSRLVVSQSRKGNKKFMVMSFGMSILSLASVFVNFRDTDYRNGFETFLVYNDAAYVCFKMGLLFGFFFFGIIGVYFIKRNKKNREVLIADHNGIIDNSTMISFGFIPWKDINRVYVNNCLKQYFIELEIKDEQKYLKKISWWKRLVAAANKAMGHQIVCITLNATEADLGDTVSHMEAIFINAKKYELTGKYR